MNYIQLTKENIDKEHLCCATSNKLGTAAKRAWLKEQLNHGLFFLKGDVNGKVFIEAMPIENAWVPVTGNNYMMIDCFWVGGKFKGCGYGKELLQQLIAQSKLEGKSGIAVITSEKKMPYLSDPAFLKANGFIHADSWGPFELVALPFDDQPLPTFSCGEIPDGLCLYYTAQCPFTAQYAPLFKKMADEAGVPMTLVHIDSLEKAKACPSPVTTYALFKDGKFITNEICPEKKINQILGV